MGRPVDATGQRFGMLVARQRLKRGRGTVYVCLCDCGAETTVHWSNLQGGTTRSCGCLRKIVARQRARKVPGHSVKTNVWNYYRRNASTRGHAWELDRGWFEALIMGACFYCGRHGVTTTTTAYGDVLHHNGVDRVDNDLGYTKANSVSCCKTCNQAKNTLSLDEFRSWAKAIGRHVDTWDARLAKLVAQV